MPFDEVMGKFKKGTLRSGGPSGPVVKNPKQAKAIMLSEKRRSNGNAEYRPRKRGGFNSIG